MRAILTAFHVEQYLSQVAGFLREHNAKLGYVSKEDFVLKHGRAWDWRRDDDDWPRMEPNFCFHNSGELAMARKDLTYVEGFVWRGKLPIPLHHAWCVTPEGFVVEPTLREHRDYDAHGREYLGVPFSTTFLRASWRGRDTCPVLDHFERDFPVLKKDFVYVKRVHEARLSRELRSERMEA